MKDIIKFLYFKYKGDWLKIFIAIKNKEEVKKEQLERARVEYKFDDYITIVDNEYPNDLKKMVKPPFILHKSTRVIVGVLVTKYESTRHVFIKKKDPLQDIYDMLECSCIDVQTRTIGGKKFDIYLDDEGLFKQDNFPSIVTTDYSGKIVEVIVGNAFICSTNEEGDMESLSEEDVKLIISKTKLVTKENSNERIAYNCIHATI